MGKIANLKEALVGHLTREITSLSEDGVPGNVLTTAAKVVKDFAHEIKNPDGALAVKDAKLASFLSRRAPRSAN